MFQLQEAQKIAQIGHWELNLKTDALYWSDEIFQIFGLNQQEFKASYQSLIDTVHPDGSTSTETGFSPGNTVRLFLTIFSIR